MEGSGDMDTTTDVPTTGQPSYNHNTTAILLVAAFVVSFAALGVCYWACTRKRPAKSEMGARMLTDDLEVPTDGQPYLSLSMRGSDTTESKVE